MNNTLDEPSPDKLLEPFERTPLVKCLIWALALHVLVILVTSPRYIYDAWIDPEGAATRAAAATEPAAEEPEVQPDALGEPQAAEASAEPASEPLQQQDAEDPEGAVEPPASDGELSPVEKRVTEAAEPEEIPNQPDLGLDLEDTNP